MCTCIYLQIKALTEVNELTLMLKIIIKKKNKEKKQLISGFYHSEGTWII